jgi:starch phosphorylase
LSSERLKVVYLEDYDMTWGRSLTSGVDLWLNTPLQPYEASGTSGMKAALNGVPSLSVLDGWWIEGCLEGLTGWSIGKVADIGGPATDQAASLYNKLDEIVRLFYQRPASYGEVMRTAIAINGSFFHTQRMVSQYMANAYFPAEPLGPQSAGHHQIRNSACPHCGE